LQCTTNYVAHAPKAAYSETYQAGISWNGCYGNRCYGEKAADISEGKKEPHPGGFSSPPGIRIPRFIQAFPLHSLAPVHPGRASLETVSKTRLFTENFNVYCSHSWQSYK